jgi:hypothetical protein
MDVLLAILRYIAGGIYFREEKALTLVLILVEESEIYMNGLEFPNFINPSLIRYLISAPNGWVSPKKSSAWTT